MLDFDALKGWRLEVYVPPRNLHRTLLISQIALEGGGDMLGASFYSNSWEKALEDDTITELFFNSEISKNESSQVIFDGQFYVDYTVQQTETWGGFVQYDFAVPGRAYYNLSKAEAIGMKYHTIEAASPPNRAHLRFLIMDTSDCLDDCGHLSPNLENYYSFHFILDGADKQGSLEIELRGDEVSDSPLWRTGWFGIIGNNVFDKTHVKGFKFEISLDSQGEMGSLVSGAFQLSELRALKDYDPNKIDTSKCIVEPNLFIHQDNNTSFKRIEFLNFEECCDLCNLDEACNYAFSDGIHCYKTDVVKPESIVIGSKNNNVGSYLHSNTEVVTFIKKSEDNICNFCECRASDLTVDCRGRDLIRIPTVFNPSEVRGPPGWPAWMPVVLDLRGNENLLVIGSDVLNEMLSIEDLRLPSTIVHIAPSTLKGLQFLKLISFGDSARGLDADVKISNAVVDPSSSYSNICCGQGWSVELSPSSPVPSLTFCDFQPDLPGRDAVYEDFIQYYGASVVDALTPSSDFMFEAAENRYKCAEYCNIRSDCHYFSYDARITNTEHLCLLLADSGTPVEICCKAEHYEDEEELMAGWVSGRVPRSRHIDDNARVIFKPTTHLVADMSSDYTATFEVSLGSMPLRGAVWIEPKASATTGMEVVFSPPRVVLYDGATTARVMVSVVDPTALEKGGTVVIENEVASCDTAFSVKQPENSVIVEVIVHGESETTTKYLWIAIGASLLIILLLTLYFLNLVERKKRQADSVWNVGSSEIQFGDPPTVIGSGSFGLVVLAEFRGTKVAVKRALPPRKDRKHRAMGTGSSPLNTLAIFDHTDAVLGDDNAQGSCTTDLELGLSSCNDNEKQLGILDAAEARYRLKYWKKSFQYSKSFDFQLQDFTEEMRHLSKLRHPNITTVMGTCPLSTLKPEQTCRV